MDFDVTQKVAKYCGDLLELLVDLLPNNLSLVEIDDQWHETSGFYDERCRRLLFIDNQNNEDSEDIAQDIIVSATGDGWTIVDDEDERETILENGNSTLCVRLGRYQSRDVIQVSIEQKWPSDVHPPVQMSDLFIQACQNIIQLHDFPISLQRDLCFDLASSEIIRTRFERVQYRFNENIERHLYRSGYKKSDEFKDKWKQSSTEEHYRFEAEVHLNSEKKILDYTLLTIDQSLQLVD